MKKFYRVPHFWIILAIMIFGALFYYADRIPFLQGIVATGPFQFAQYSTYRILSLTPVAYAAFIFRWRGGVITAVIVGLALLPRAILQTVQVEAITETIAFFFIGLLITWLIYRQQQALAYLATTRDELQENVAVIRDNEKRLAILNRMSNTISDTLDLDTILNNAIDNVIEVMQADAAWIFLLDEAAQELTLAAHRGASEELARGIDHLKLGEGHNGLVARNGKPLYVEDASRDPRLTREIVSRYRVGSTLIVPIASKRQIKGTLCIAMFGPRTYPAQEVDLMTALANQLGIALENAHLYQQQQTISQQLRQSEEQYRGVFENSSDALFVCSTDARIISVNRAGERLTGYTRAELTGTAIANLFTRETRAVIRTLFSGKPQNVPAGNIGEVTVTRKDGTEAFIELKASTLFRRGQVSGVQIIAQDITEEKRLRQDMEFFIRQVTRAQEDERLRVSRELHDDTAQVLASLSRDIDAVINGEDNLPGPVVEKMKQLHGMADAALEGVRRFSQDLRPSILDDLGLEPALEWIISDLEHNHGMTATVEITGQRSRLSPEIELTVFRIAQEVLSNIRRHSRATAVEMKLDFGDDALTLILGDNGVGFDVPSRTIDLAQSGQLGIIGMRERARLIGGELSVRSSAGNGTTVELKIPR